MKLRILVSSLLLALVSAAPAIRAQDAAPQKEEKTDLDKQMDKIRKAFMALRKQITDASKNDASIALVATIHDAAVEAAKMTPAKAADLPDADKAKFTDDYQSGMKDFVTAVDKLTDDLKAGNNDAAAADLKALGSLESKDHKKFRKPEKE